jgi:hypothetical protein
VRQLLANALSKTVPFLLVAVSIVSATYVSGIEFPGQNNQWHIPIVLDFAGSKEGPHDKYYATFTRFVSFFWLAVRYFTNEASLEQTFIILQLLGNVAVAICILGLSQCALQKSAGTATSMLCFAYGLWGLTKLGQSEIFSAYATHTQFAIAACLLAFMLLLRQSAVASGLTLGIAANVNLFIAFWSLLAASAWLQMPRNGLSSKHKWQFFIAFAVFAAPVLWWVAQVRLSTPKSDVELEFFKELLAGHLYAFEYPQALLHTLLLGASAGIATVRFPKGTDNVHKVGLLTVVATVVLLAGALTPYLYHHDLIIALQPLRFASVVVILAAACSVALFVSNISGIGSSIFPVIALAGFMMKLPLVSILGFSFAIVPSNAAMRLARISFPLLAIAATLLHAPPVAPNAKHAIAALLATLVVGIGYIGLKIEHADRHVSEYAMCLTWSLLVLCVPPFPSTLISVAIILLSIPILLAAAGEISGSQYIVMGTWGIGAATLLHWHSGHDTLFAIEAIGLGATLVFLWLPRSRAEVLARHSAPSILALIVAAMVMAGAVRAYQTGFGASHSKDARNYRDAQEWARINTKPGALFYVPGRDGFSLFSRRPVWWEHAQLAAVLWAPDFYSVFKTRRALALQHTDGPALVTLARTQSIKYLVLPVASFSAHAYSPFEVAYANESYVILRSPE